MFNNGYNFLTRIISDYKFKKYVDQSNIRHNHKKYKAFYEINTI